MPIRLRAKSRNFGAGPTINKGTMRVQIPCLATNRMGTVHLMAHLPGHQSLHFAVSGPWPPFSFCPTLETEPA